MKEKPFVSAPSGDRTIVLSGELDLADLDTLQAQFEEAASASRTVIVDLRDVTYMDSSAIGALIRLYRQLRGVDGTLRVRARHNSAYRLLEISGLIETLSIEIVP